MDPHSESDTDTVGGVDLFDRRPVRVILFVIIPVVILALVCAGIRVSQYGIDHTILVFGQQQLVRGWPAAIRVTLVDDGGRYFLPTRMTGSLVRGEQRHELFDGPVEDRGNALARNFSLPEVASGPAQLELDIRFDDRRRIVRSEVEIMDRPPEGNLTLPRDVAEYTGPTEVVKDGVRLAVFTEDRGAPTGLTSAIFLRATDEQGRPVTTGFVTEITGGSKGGAEQEERRPDRLGIVALPVTPLELSVPIRIPGARRADQPAVDGGVADGGAVPDEAFLYPKVVYGGITAAVHNPIVFAGEPLKVTVQQISQGGPVYADVFQEGRWVQALSAWFAGSSANLEIRPVRRGLGRVQLTTSAIAPGGTVAVRHFYVLGENEDATAGLRAILAALKERGKDDAWVDAALGSRLEGGAGFDRRLTAAFALGRLYEGHQELEMLVSSRREDDAELGAFKARFQRFVMLAILLVGFGVASLIALIAVQSHRRHQRLTMMIMAEDDEGNEGDYHTDMGARAAAKGRVLLQGAILFVIILGAFASIALLIDTLTWQQLVP